MKKEDLLHRISTMNVWKQFAQRAPHKPLLILYALGRLINEKRRMLDYEEVERDLTGLLQRFGPPRKKQYADQPFKRLPGDGLWEIAHPPELTGDRKNFSSFQMRKFKVQGGFPSEIHDFFLANPDIVETVVQLLLRDFPKSFHPEIRRSVGLDWTTTVLDKELALFTSLTDRTKTKRNPRFRADVLRAYSRNCCVCGSDLRLDDSLFDLEAAHIMWHAYGGPDEVPNGLALCGFHHKSFDHGGWGLDHKETDFIIKVSDDLNGQSDAIKLLLDFQNQPIRLPRKSALFPDHRYIQWHSKEVFRE